MTEVRIRSMMQEDCRAVYEIEAICFPDTSWTLEDFGAALSADSQYYYVAECEGSIAGFAALYVMVDCGDLVNIAVHPSFRGRGISRLLMEVLLEAAAGLALTCVTLEVRKSNTVAMHLYEEYGFAPISIRKGYYKEPLEDAVVMQWNIEGEYPVSLYSR